LKIADTALSRRLRRNSDQPREARADHDLFEVTVKKGVQRRRAELLDMLGVVPDAPDIFAPGKVAQSKEWLPRHRHDAMATTDAS
jgi:hypothetical protein